MKQYISAITLLSISSAAFAQEADVQILPTTVVTGELWESDIQQTTASVTVIEQAALENNGVQHFEDVVNSIPNLTWTGGSSRPRYIQIRGIGENSQYEGETPDSSVRFLIDDLDLTGVGTVGNLFDVEQVEVLRGPQAGAFGANAAGGVVRIVSNEPTPYWTGQIEATVGNDNLRAGGIAVGGPLIESDPEQLTFRLSVHQLEQDGFRENQFLDQDDTNARDELTTRLKVRWLANDDWQFDATLFYADVDNGFDEFNLSNHPSETDSDEPGHDEQETFGSSFRITWAGLENATLTSITSYTTSDSLYSFDSDWSNIIDKDPTLPATYKAYLATERDRDVFSQELRLDSNEQENALGWIDRWTIGLYYHAMNENSGIYYDEIYAGWADDAYIESEYDSETIAIFTQFAHNFSDSTRLSIGLRLEHHQVDFTTNTINNYYTELIDGKNSFEESNTLFGGKLTLEHDLNDNHTAFASAARGYKSGGANSGAFRLDFDPETYEDETLYNFELGLRSHWFDGRIISSLTGFYLQRQDAQLRDSQGSGGFFRYLTVNGDNAAHYGLESEITWYIDEAWTLYATLGLLGSDRDAYDTLESDEEVDETLDVDSDDDPITITVDSRDLANAPSYSYSVGLAYDRGDGFFGNAQIVAKDDYYESNSHNEKRDSFAVVNAALGYRWDNWTVTLWAKNLFDEEYTKRIFYFNNLDGGIKRYESLADPRTFGVTANYSW
ncbi:TonB-dependent receptor [Coraliomargarita algicola]|uniref:TonB-dependent receptor n=1 Tax=Coraliomargarita algicola TaxID=3092156 RepID=A0ABZ0RJP7_9BACT|nr:TonB-dependent receptor [Coraliomargarita sp. J2-16]WPJ95757.1 TonB-dependent receptor [Coraliomargarita sp. J2-16]